MSGAVRSFSARVDVLRGGVRRGSLRFADWPDIIMNGEALIKSSLSGVFALPEDVDWLSDELRPVVIIDGAESALGVFRAASVTELEADDRPARVRVEAYDRCWQVQRRKTESLLSVPAGTGYLDAVEARLVECGISLTLRTPTALTLPAALEWETGTDNLTIVNALLSAINYAQLWFDGEGRAVLRPKETPGADAIAHRYDEDDPTCLLLPTYQRESDVYARPNVIVAICASPDLPEPLVARAENNDPRSALSIVRRGCRVTETVKVDSIASQAELDSYAARLIYESQLSGETVTLETAIQGGHGVGDTVALRRAGARGLYTETGWSITLGPGQKMRHTLKKAVIT